MGSAELHTDGPKSSGLLGDPESGLPRDHRIDTVTAHKQLLN